MVTPSAPSPYLRLPVLQAGMPTPPVATANVTGTAPLGRPMSQTTEWHLRIQCDGKPKLERTRAPNAGPSCSPLNKTRWMHEMGSGYS